VDLTREAAERAMLAFAVVACNGNSRHEAEPVVRQFLIACIGQLPKESDMTATKTKPAKAGKTATGVQKVDASKENAKAALQTLTVHGNRVFSKTEYDQLVAFVTAAVGRLPGQAAIDRDKERKKNYHETKRKPARAKAAEPASTPAETEVFLHPELKVEGTETHRHEPELSFKPGSAGSEA
jgi:hypothetical protein